jgi:hypothetical protein
MLQSNSIDSCPLDSAATEEYRWDKLIYKTCLTLFLVCFSTIGFGNFLFGLELPTNTTTFFIYLIFVVQLVSDSLRFSKFLFFLWLYIFIQTFMLNWSYMNFQSSSIHFIGFIIFSLVSFSFFSKNRFKIFSIIQVYYKFCFFIACLAIVQFFLFVVFNISFLPQNILSGSLAFQGRDSFSPEILGVFPRAVGLSTEPAHYVAVLLPAVYISIYTLTGTKELFNTHNKTIAFTILFGFIISFSLVGYFGLALCFFIIFRKKMKISLLKISILLFGFIGLLYFILQTSIGEKVYSFISVSKDVTGAEYTPSDQSSFALLSNLMVAIEGLKLSNFLGTGLNTHMVTYDATMSTIFSESQIIAELNKENAGSMFIRIVSEFGLPGLLIFIWLLTHFKVDKKIRFSSNSAINNMCFIFLIMYCLRNGDYLNMLFFFFLSMYYYTYIVSKEVNQSGYE